MAKLLVGTYQSRRDAEAVRQRLVERGVGASQINIHGPGGDEASAAGIDTLTESDAPREPRGLAATIGRMFSGLFPDKADRERYERSMRTGAVLVAVRDLDEAAVERAKPVLAQHGSVDVHALADDVRSVERAQAMVERSAGFAPQTRDSADPEATASGRGPRIYTLANAPSGWNQASEGERSTVLPEQDPARPEGVVRGTNHLGATEGRERLERNRPR